MPELAFLVDESSEKNESFQTEYFLLKINTTGRPLALCEVPSIINHAGACWKQKVLHPYSFSLGNREPLTSFME